MKRLTERARRQDAVRAVVRGLCLAASVLALLTLGGKVAQGVSAVADDEMTAAEMFLELGAWLRGG